MKQKPIFLLMAAALTLGLVACSDNDDEGGPGAHLDIVEINERNFPDSQFRNWLLGRPSGADGVLTDDEIAKDTLFNLSNLGIRSLQGIEYFYAMIYLNCNGNQLTSLDVSKKTALRALHFSGNPLTAVNLSGCSSLKNLDFSKHDLTSLKVSGCSSLEHLFCYNNRLETLDMSGCTSLKSLVCDSNQLKSINVSGLDHMIYLSCNVNQLTSIDVSGCSALENFDCFENQLTTIDLTDCTSLTQLRSHNNRLTSLDVSNCPQLRLITIYQNQIKGEAMDALLMSLPPLTFKEPFRVLYVLWHENEQNEITAEQAKAANGWRVWYCDGTVWQEFNKSK